MYYFSKLSKKTFNSNGEEIPMDDNSLLYQEYLNFINNNGIVEEVEKFQNEVEEISVPGTVSQMRLRKALILAGISISSINDTIAAIVDDTQRELIYSMWEYAVVFERSDATLNQMASTLGITQIQLDQLFINAQNL